MRLSDLLKACNLTQLDEEDEAFEGLDEIVIEGLQSFSHKASTLSQPCIGCLGALSWQPAPLCTGQGCLLLSPSVSAMQNSQGNKQQSVQTVACIPYRPAWSAMQCSNEA